MFIWINNCSEESSISYIENFIFLVYIKLS